jgi:hypothetical protein
MVANAQTLVLAMVVHDTLNGPEATDAMRPATLHAAVHAWMEGHVEGEGRVGTTSLPGTRRSDDPMPMPPFPRRDNERLRSIRKEANERFADGEPVAAVLFASGLAYQAGLEEGEQCPGCVVRARPGALTDAARVRTGQLPVTLKAGGPSLVDTT